MNSLLKGNPIKAILLFTIPLILGNLLQQVFAISDTFIVGKYLGVKQLAGVGSTGTLSWLVIGFAQGFTAGTAIVTAKRFGANDFKGVRKSMATTIIATTFLTILTTVISVIFTKQILYAMNTPDDIYQYAYSFIAIIFGTMFSVMIYNLAANVLRAVGDSKTPLKFLVVAIVLNIILELIFILYFRWGVVGAAIATAIAQLVSGILSFQFIYRNVPELAVRRSDFKLDKDDLKEHLFMGMPMAFQNSVLAIGGLIVQTALNSLGTDAVAASAASSKIAQISTLPMMSIGIAVATFVAQNLGARQYKRILTGVRQALIATNSWAILMGVLEILFGHILVSYFIGSNHQHILQLSKLYFLIGGSMYVFLASLFTIRYALQGLGNARVPTIAAFSELTMRIIGAIVLVSIFKYAGAVASDPLAWIGSILILLPAWFKAIKKLKSLQDGQAINGQLQPIASTENKNA
ncbi:MAG: MATE family efflux transporter [Lactobacillaceae bacterium]|jgi:putative MATE family efflux protein|nr:MATE family efflux transporter [Lactobacillaceae bacterium]